MLWSAIRRLRRAVRDRTRTAVVDFEAREVLLKMHLVRVERQRAVVHQAGSLELTPLLVRDREIVGERVVPPAAIRIAAALVKRPRVGFNWRGGVHRTGRRSARRSLDG